MKSEERTEYGKEGKVKERKNEDEGGRDRDIRDVQEEGGKERVVAGERRGKTGMRERWRESWGRKCGRKESKR